MLRPGANVILGLPACVFSLALGMGSLGVDGPAILGVMELCLVLNDACSVTLFYFYAVLK